MEVAGEPMLAHALRAVEPLEPERGVVVTGHRGEQIRGRFGSRWSSLDLTYVRQPNPSGLAHALLAAEPKLAGAFVVLNGDNVVRADLAPAVRRFRAGQLDALVVTEQVPPDRARQGVCLTGPEGRLARIVEHPAAEQRGAGRVMTGFNVFSPRVLEACRRVEPSAVPDGRAPDGTERPVPREVPHAAFAPRGAADLPIL